MQQPPQLREVQRRRAVRLSGIPGEDDAAGLMLEWPSGYWTREGKTVVMRKDGKLSLRTDRREAITTVEQLQVDPPVGTIDFVIGSHRAYVALWSMASGGFPFTVKAVDLQSGRVVWTATACSRCFGPTSRPVSRVLPPT